MRSPLRSFKTASARKSRRGSSIHVVIFERGGIAAEARRLIFNWEGSFTAFQIRRALVRQYPDLQDNIPPTQLEDVIQRLLDRRHVVCVAEFHACKVYRRSPRPARKPVKRNHQLRFTI